MSTTCTKRHGYFELKLLPSSTLNWKLIPILKSLLVESILKWCQWALNSIIAIYPHWCNLETNESKDPYNIVILETCISGGSHKNNAIVTGKRHETRTSDWLMRAVKCLDGRMLSIELWWSSPCHLGLNLSTTVDHFTQAANKAPNAKWFEDPDGCSHFPSSSSPSSSSSWSSSSSSESSSSFFPCQ